MVSDLFKDFVLNRKGEKKVESHLGLLGKCLPHVDGVGVSSEADLNFFVKCFIVVEFTTVKSGSDVSKTCGSPFFLFNFAFFLHRLHLSHGQLYWLEKWFGAGVFLKNVKKLHSFCFPVWTTGISKHITYRFLVRSEPGNFRWYTVSGDFTKVALPLATR